MRQQLFTCSEASRALGLSEVALRQRIRRGVFPCVRDGGRVFIRAADLDAHLARLGSPVSPKASVRLVAQR